MKLIHEVQICIIFGLYCSNYKQHVGWDQKASCGHEVIEFVGKDGIVPSHLFYRKLVGTGFREGSSKWIH